MAILSYARLLDLIALCRRVALEYEVPRKPLPQEDDAPVHVGSWLRSG